MLVKLLAAYTHLHVFSFPFLRYSKLLVENCDIFIPHLCLAPPAGGDPVVISWLLMLVKLEWFGYRMVKKYDDMLSRFHTIPTCHGQTDGPTELLHQYRASVCWRAIKSSVTGQRTVMLCAGWAESRWLFGLTGNALVSINVVALRRARLVLGWVAVSWSTTLVFNQATHAYTAWPPLRG